MNDKLLSKFIDEILMIEAFDKPLEDDPALKKDSVIVPGDAKRVVKKWYRAMRLNKTSTKKTYT